VAAFGVADDCRLIPPPNNAAAFAARGRFYFCCGHDLAAHFFGSARKIKTYGRTDVPSHRDAVTRDPQNIPRRGVTPPARTIAIS
jgi:hypothetical protein